MLSLILSLIYFSIPAGVLVFFIVSLVMYCSAKAANKRQPGAYTDSQMTTRKLLLFISGGIAAVLVAGVVLLMALMFMAVAYM